MSERKKKKSTDGKPTPVRSPAPPVNRRVKNQPMKRPANDSPVVTREEPDATEVNWPALNVELHDVSAVVPDPKNPRLHSDGQIAQIANSIKVWGFTMPLLLDEAGQIIAGHARFAAAQSLGLKRVPVLVARGWSEAQRRAYVLADNRLAMNSSWDDALLIDSLAALRMQDFDLAALGFTDKELSDMLGAADPDAIAPGGLDDQGRLDVKAPITCPECGFVWSPP